jgi:hypothetical protein
VNNHGRIALLSALTAAFTAWPVPPRVTLVLDAGSSRTLRLDSISGLLTGIGIDGGGRVVALDGRMGRVVVFDTAGKYQFARERGQSQPGRLMAPGSLVVSGSVVSIHDPAAKAIHEYRLGGSTLTPTRDIPVGADGNQMCVAGNRFVVTGESDDSLAATYRSEGGPEKMLSPFRLHDNDNYPTRVYLRQTRLLCGADGSLVVASAPLGIVRAYRGGRLAWEATIRGFHPIAIDNEGPRSTVFSSRDGYDEIITLLALDESHLLVQFRSRTREEARTHGVGSIHSRILSLADGGEAGEAPGLARALVASRSQLYFVDDASSSITRMAYRVQRVPGGGQ